MTGEDVTATEREVLARGIEVVRRRLHLTTRGSTDG